ncbi:MAG: 2OG-Fe(II) oxygenase [Spirulinaceae cyanobacterium]
MVFVSDSFATQEVKVTLLLSGGHEKTFYLPSDHPLLYELVYRFMTSDVSQATPPSWQIPLQENRAALYLSAEHLIGVITEPPVQLNVENSLTKLPETPETLLQDEGQPQLEVIPSESVQLDDLLTSEEQQQLLNYVIAKEKDFIPSNTSTQDLNYRQSSVLYSFPNFSELIVTRIKKVLPQVCSQLGISSFNPTEVETQLTAHNQGNYYRIHNDNGSPDTANRLLTYVYYFYREPKSFGGGELVIYDSKIENNFYVEADSYQTVEPRQNSIVFFLSRYMHEVLPINCQSQAFRDSRFTINGWIRQEDF